MTAPKLPTAPRHLSKASRAWWRSVVAEYELEPHLLRVLGAAAESLDVLTEAQARLRVDGMFLTDRLGVVRTHPAVAVARDARIGFARLVRELGLDTGSDPDAARPPRVGTGARS